MHTSATRVGRGPQYLRNLSAPPLAAPSGLFPAHAAPSPLQLLDLPLQPDFLRDQLSARGFQHSYPLSRRGFSDGDDILCSVSCSRWVESGSDVEYLLPLLVGLQSGSVPGPGGGDGGDGCCQNDPSSFRVVEAS